MPPVPESDQALDWVKGNLPAEETAAPAAGSVESLEPEAPAAETPPSLPSAEEAQAPAEPEAASQPEPDAAEAAVTDALAEPEAAEAAPTNASAATDTPAESDAPTGVEAAPDVPAAAEPALESSPLPEVEAEAEPSMAPLPAPEVVEEPPLPPLPPTEPLSLENLVESLLFVAEGPVPVARLAEALEVSPREAEAALDQLAETYRHRGLSVQRLRDRVQLTTTPAAAERVQRFLGLAAATPLSRAALETLAIIAYQQPVTRPQIEAVRGVNSDGVIKNLLSKGIIDEVGRTDGPGRPVLYTTTPEFLQYFGLTSLADLPSLNLDQRPAALVSGSSGNILKE